MKRLADTRGTITLGWINPRAFYVDLQGVISGSLGVDAAATLGSMLHGTISVAGFVNAQGLQAADGIAQEALVRALVTGDNRWTRVTTLVASTDFARVARALSVFLGVSHLVTCEEQIFAAELNQLAPGGARMTNPHASVEVLQAGSEHR